MESTLWEYNSPRKRNLGVFVANTWQHFPSSHCHNYYYYVVFWPLLSYPSTDRNKTRTWFSLSPLEHFRKIWYKSVHNLLSYRGHRHTDRQRRKPTTVRTFAARTNNLALHIEGDSWETEVYNVLGYYVTTECVSCGILWCRCPPLSRRRANRSGTYWAGPVLVGLCIATQ